MARLPRLALDGALHHVGLRGHNRQPVFIDDADRARLLELVMAQAAIHHIALHAFVLLESSIDLLVTPREGAALSHCMQAIGRSYVRYFNDRHGRSGTLWEGRFRSTILQAEEYLIDAMVSFDLAAVAAGVVAHPQDHIWSSHGHYAGLRTERGITPHQVVWALGNTPFEREAAYRNRVDEGIGADRTEVLRLGWASGWALGDSTFLARLQHRTPRRITPLPPGRPTINNE